MAKRNEVITEAEVTAASNKAVASAEKDRKELAKTFREQEKVPVSISPLYMPYFGRVMTVTINGASIAIPVDGRSYMVPESFAEEIQIRIYRRDQLIKKQNKMSDITNNCEASPGELALF
jgi:hypothetical protein